MKKLSLLTLAFLVCSMPDIASAARSTDERIIERSGRRISSVFDNLSPNPEFVRLLAVAQERASICPKATTRTLVLHQSDHISRLLKVQQDCVGHRADFEIRSCGSSCNGGAETWTFIDAYGDYYQGWAFDHFGCATGNCLEEYTCYNGNIH